jgi:hypothetical protein
MDLTLALPALAASILRNLHRELTNPSVLYPTKLTFSVYIPNGKTSFTIRFVAGTGFDSW